MTNIKNNQIISLTDRRFDLWLVPILYFARHEQNKEQVAKEVECDRYEEHLSPVGGTCL